MADTMSETDLVAAHKASLQDCSSVFTAADDADLKRHIAKAATDFARVRPRTLVGSFALVAEQSDYAALPSDFHLFKSAIWGVPAPGARPWDCNWPGRLPDFGTGEIDGVRKIVLTPAPTGAQIATLGATYRYYYAARHTVHATNGALTTIREGDRHALLLRAQAEAMREMTFRNVHKPVQIMAGTQSQPRNGMPSYLFEMLMDEFEAITQ